jgi:hypothetical protein
VGGATVEVSYYFLTGVSIGTAKAMAHVQNSDIHASNGMIHVIDTVIMPESLAVATSDGTRENTCPVRREPVAQGMCERRKNAFDLLVSNGKHSVALGDGLRTLPLFL